MQLKINISMVNMKDIRVAILVLAATAVALLTVSCAQDDESSQRWGASNMSSSEAVYEGKWSLGMASGWQGVAAIDMRDSSTGVFRLRGVPRAEIVRQFFPDGSVVPAADYFSMIVESQFVVTSTSDNTLLYMLQPAVWNIPVLVGDKPGTLGLNISSQSQGDDDLSWGTLSKSGVLTLVIHVTSYQLDGGGQVPSALKMVFTATRKK